MPPNQYGHRLRELYEDGGLREVCRGIRDFIHTRHIYERVLKDDYNDVRLGTGYGFFPVHSHRNRVSHKFSLIEEVDENVRPGDTVTIVGSRGVDTVHALWAGADSVTVYEGALSSLIECRQAVNHPHNGVDPSKVTIQHAVVGDPVNVYDDLQCVPTINPSNIHTGDVLILDCEGSERTIIPGLYSLPQTVIVETHPQRGAKSDLMTSLLRSRGYAVSRRDFEPFIVPRKEVLVGKLNP